MSRQSILPRRGKVHTTKKVCVKQAECIFCAKATNQPPLSFGPLICKALYTKYSSSQNYYYSRDINDILGERRTAAVGLYRDIEHMIEDEEYLKRWYVVGENTFKMNQLTDYYKYHKDIPRMFMFKICKTIHKFHDRRRRLEYAKIKGRLGIANDDHIYSESTFLGNRKSQQSQDCSAQHLKYMLRGVDLSIKHTEPVQHLTLKDILNSIIKNKATQETSFEQSFFKGSFLLLQDVDLQPKNKIAPPILNLVKIFGRALASNPGSPQISPQVSPRTPPQPMITTRQPSLKVVQTMQSKLITQALKMQQNLQSRRGSQNGSQNASQTGSVTTREPQRPTPQLMMSNQTFFKNVQGSLTSRNSEQLQKLMLQQKLIQQQLADMSIKSKLTQSKSLHRSNDITSPKPQPTPPPQQFFAHQKSQSNVATMQKNNHFLQPVFSTFNLNSKFNAYPAANIQTKRSTSLVQSLTSRFKDKFTQSHQVSPQRAISKKVPVDISIKIQSGRLIPSTAKGKKPSIYTINQNNIVNIYMDDKAKMSSTTSSPIKLSSRKESMPDYRLPFQQVQVSFKKRLN